MFAAGKMPAGPSQFVAQTYPLKQLRSALAHLRIRQLAELAHGDHYIFLGSEVLHQKMELKDKADKSAALLRELIVS